MRLTHLSGEEKQLRRKLKNRMAAQSARDRKKHQMEELEELVLKLERQNASLVKENRNLRLTIATEKSSQVQQPTLTKELLESVQLPSSESAEFSPVLPQKERTAAWVRRQLVMRLTSASRCITCFMALMLTSSLKSRMSSSKPLTVQEKQLLLRLHSANQSRTCCHKMMVPQQMHATSWWGPQQSTWNPAKICV